jgi:hypothetical protein
MRIIGRNDSITLEEAKFILDCILEEIENISLLPDLVLLVGFSFPDIRDWKNGLVCGLEEDGGISDEDYDRLLSLEQATTIHNKLKEKGLIKAWWIEVEIHSCNIDYANEILKEIY